MIKNDDLRVMPKDFFEKNLKGKKSRIICKKQGKDSEVEYIGTLLNGFGALGQSANKLAGIQIETDNSIEELIIDEVVSIDCL
jgi:hypothetical protein